MSEIVEQIMLAFHGWFKTLQISIPTLVDAFKHRLTREACDERLRDWSQCVFDRAQIQMEVEGLNHLDDHPDEAFVLMSNHLSTYDIIVLFVAMQWRSLRMLVKGQLMDIPVWGQAMAEADFVRVDRENLELAKATLNRAGETLNPRIHYWAAPESTRSRTGKLLRFGKGSFHFARKAKRRIIPVTLIGTADIVSVDSFRVRRGARVKVIFGAPVDPFAFDDMNDLVAHVRSEIASRLPV